MSLIDRATSENIIKINDDRKTVVYVRLNKKYRYADPEEQVRVETYLQLIYNYGYEPSLIDIEVVVPRRTPSDLADIVDELKTNPSFGWEYFLARKLKEKVGSDYFRNIAVFKEKTRTALVALFKFLFDRKLLEQNDDDVEKAFQGLLKVNEIYGHESRLSDNFCVGLLIAFIYYYLKSPLLLPSFKSWIMNNHLYELSETSATNLNTMAVGITTIFDKILDAKGKTIFVSMPFGEDKTEENSNFIKETVNEINKEYGLDIKIEPIRVDEYNPGHSFKIPDKILELISEAGLLIADLTYGNKNVYHELGYLMGLNDGRLLPQENFIMIFREGISEQKEPTDFEIGFNVRSDYQIRFTRMDDLKIKLKAMLLKHYSLG